MNLPPAGLVLFHTRRALWPGGVFVPLLSYLVRGTGQSSHASAELNQLWQTQALWSSAAISALLVLILRAAALGKRYQDADRAWIGARPRTRGQVLGAELSGLILAAATLALGTLAFAKILDATPAASRSRLTTLENPGTLLVEGDRAFAWSPPSGLDGASEVSVGVTIGPGSGPTAPVRFALVDAAGERLEVEQRAFGPTTLRVALPPTFDRESATLHIERDGPGALLVVLPGTVELFEPASGLVGLRLTALLFAALASAAALSLAAGTWMRPGLAAALTAVTLFTVGLRGGAPAIARLTEAIAGMEHGIAPPAALPAVLSSTLLLALAFALACLGRRHGGVA